MKKRLPGIIFLLSLTLLVVCSHNSCSTSAFFYHPEKTIRHYPDSTRCMYENAYFKTADSSRLHGWLIRSLKDVEPLATVLLFHGNAGNVGYQFQSLMPLAEAGFQCFVFDYREFGKSEGKVSQEHVLEDGLAALRYLRGRPDVAGQKIILFGQSLGGHLAVVVAAQKQSELAALVTEGAFSGHEQIAEWAGKKQYRAPKFLTRWFVPSKYDAIEVVEQIGIPKLFIHSTEDQEVPFFMSKELYEKAKEPKELWEIKGPHIRCYQLYTEEFVQRFRDILKEK
ncbi:MAG: alpha/beta hydrolase [Bacteroidota bacterium]